MNILFYGNCQLTAIYKTLNLSNNYKQYNICCWATDYNKEQFTNIINCCDIIITQPINDNYRDQEHLSTSYIINNSKNNCKIIIIDSCHFDFYYIDLTYKFFNNEILKIPHDYHYDNIID